MWALFCGACGGPEWSGGKSAQHVAHRLFFFDRREFSPTSFFPSLALHISFSSIFKPSANIRNLSTCRLELLYGLRIFPLHIVLLVDCLKYRVLLLSLFRATTYLLYFVICLPFPMN